MTHSIVGVDLGSTTIRAVELEGAATAHPVIRTVGQISVPPGVIESGEVIQGDAVAELLRQLWSTFRFRSTRVVLGVGNSRVLVRDHTVPRATPAQMRHSLPFTAQDLLTVPVDEAVLDFYPNSEALADGAPMVSGLLVAAVTDTVNAAVAAATLAGLTVVDVDLAPFALVRAQLASFQTSTVAMVDVGSRTTTVVVSARGVPCFVRIIPTGGGDLTRLLAEKLGVPPEDAERTKREVGLVLGVAEHGHTEAAAVINEFSNDLLQGVRNTLRYFTNAHPQNRLEGIVLTGGGAQLRGLPAALAEITRLPSLTGKPLGGLRFADDGPASSLEALELPGALTVALGLVIGRGRAETAGGVPRPQVSLLPPEITLRARARRLNRSLVLAAAGVLVLTVGAVGGAHWIEGSTQNELDAARAETTALVAQQAAFSESRQLAQLLATLQDARFYGASTEIDWAEYLALIEATMPTGTTLIEASVDAAAPWEIAPAPAGPLRGEVAGTLHLRASSPSESDLTVWVRSLESLPGYADSSLDGRVLELTGDTPRYTADVTLNVSATARAGRFTAAPPPTPDGPVDGTVDAAGE